MSPLPPADLTLSSYPQKKAYQTFEDQLKTPLPPGSHPGVHLLQLITTSHVNAWLTQEF